ncbi:carbon starvation protein A, partial [Nesterenkonia aurantiaca]
FLPVLIPMAFVLVMSSWAAVVQVFSFFNDGEWLLFSINVVIIFAAVWVLAESIMSMKRAWSGEKEPEDDVALTAEEKLPLR